MVNKEYFQFDYFLNKNTEIQEKIFDISKLEILKKINQNSLGFLSIYHKLFYNTIDNIGDINSVIQNQISNRMMFDYYK